MLFFLINQSLLFSLISEFSVNVNMLMHVFLNIKRVFFFPVLFYSYFPSLLFCIYNLADLLIHKLKLSGFCACSNMKSLNLKQILEWESTMELRE